MATASRDVVLRFVGDTGNLAKGADDVSGRLRGVATSIEGIAKLGAGLAGVAFFGNMIDEAREAERTGKQTEAVLRSTGGAANLTAKQIGDLAGKLSEKTAVDDEVVQHGENVLLTFRNIRNEAGQGNDIFSQTTKVALDMSAALSETGDASEGLQSNMIRVGKALNDPIAGISALTKVGVSFTAQQKEQIRALTEQGDVLGAQKIILLELQSEFGGMAEATADSIGKAKVSWGNFAETVGGKVMPAVNAVSDWALTTGIPVLGHVAETVGSVVIPAFQGLMSVGQGVLGVWQALPTPIQSAAIALGIWALAGDRVTGFLGRAAGPLKNFGEEMRLQQGLARLAGEDIGRFGAGLAVLQSKVPALGQMGAAFRNARGEAAGFGATVRGVASASVSGLKSAASGLVGVLGGPWGLALGGGVALLGLWAQQNAAAEARQQALAAAGKQVAQVIAEQNGIINENVRAATAKQAADTGLLTQARDLGISGAQVTSAVLDQGSAYDDLTTKLRTQAAAQGGWTSESQIMLDNLIALHDKIQSGTDATQLAAEAQKNWNDQTQQVGGHATLAITSTDLFKQAIERAGLEFDQSATAAEQLKAAIDALTAAEMAQIDTLEGYEAAQDALDESVKRNKATLDIHTAAGRANRDALEDVAKKSRDLMQADIDSGVPMNQALARHNARIAALKKEATNTFGAKSQAVNLINTYSKVPKDVRTAIKVQGYEAANRAMLDLSAKQTALAHGVQIGSPGYAKYVAQINREKNRQRSGGFATGGLLQGPGTPTSDSIPLWGSTGEFMQQASAVNFYGVPFMNAVNQKRFPKAMAQGLAKGGPVIWPFNVDVSKTKIPQLVIPTISSAATAGSPGVVAAVRAVATQFGWGSGAQWNSLSRLITGESGWNPAAANPTSSARGLFQKLTSVNGPIEPTVAGQTLWGLNYIRGRYGSPANAYSQWLSRSPHWYDNGGWLKPGQLGYNGTKRPEAVFTQEQLADLKKPEVHKHYHLTMQVTNHPVSVRQEFAYMEAMAGL